VKCDSEGRVVGIELGGNKLQGAERVHHRKHCLFVQLDVRHRKHSCGINVEIMRGAGEIPESLGNLTNLEALNLSFNQLSGTYPVYVPEM
jgi:Leucine-rich repeat (LRR) protein